MVKYFCDKCRCLHLRKQEESKKIPDPVKCDLCGNWIPGTLIVGIDICVYKGTMKARNEYNYEVCLDCIKSFEKKVKEWEEERTVFGHKLNDLRF